MEIVQPDMLFLLVFLTKSPCTISLRFNDMIQYAFITKIKFSKISSVMTNNNDWSIRTNNLVHQLEHIKLCLAQKVAA